MTSIPVCRVTATSDCTFRRTGLRSALLLAAAIVLSVAAHASAKLQPWTGPVPPPIDLPLLDVRPLGADAQTSRVVLVHFFATWCEPCRPELAALERLRLAMPEAEVRIIAISVAEPVDRVRRFFAAHPIGFPVVLDHDRAAARRWGVSALPTTFVLGPERKPLWRADGDVDWDAGETRQLLADALRADAAKN